MSAVDFHLSTSGDGVSFMHQQKSFRLFVLERAFVDQQISGRLASASGTLQLRLRWLASAKAQVVRMRGTNREQI